MAFRITGLSPAPFKPLFDLPDAALVEHGARRMTVDAAPGFPDRITLTDAPVGSTVLLANHVSQPANSPYRASHAVFIQEGVTEPYDAIDEVPSSLRSRTLSLRGFDADGMMRDAALVEGTALEAALERLFADPAIAEAHAHYATRGCFAALIRPA